MTTLKKLSQDQSAAINCIDTFLSGDKKEFALSGAAGTGKTFLSQHILDLHPDIQLAACTNKAAKVLAVFSDRDTSTIHSLLGLRPVDDDQLGRQVLKKKGKAKVKNGGVILVDEASMVSKALLHEIRKAADEHDCKVLYVGDAYQIPPVFESESPVFKEVKDQFHLTRVHRQALHSPIISGATHFRSVLDGNPLPKLEAQKGCIHIVSQEKFTCMIKECFTSGEYLENGDHCRILGWTNKTVQSYNRYVRSLSTDSTDFYSGEKLIVNSAITQFQRVVFGTEQEVMVVEVEESKKAGIAGHSVLIRDDDDREATVFIASNSVDVKNLLSEYATIAQQYQKRVALLSGDEWDTVDKQRRAAWQDFFAVKEVFADLRPPHASTVHKSQGSTYHTVFIDAWDIGRNTKWQEIARLLYVAYTRASRQIVITGNLPDRLYKEVA